MLYVQSGAVTMKYFKLFNINVIYMQRVERELHTA